MVGTKWPEQSGVRVAQARDGQGVTGLGGAVGRPGMGWTGELVGIGEDTEPKRLQQHLRWYLAAVLCVCVVPIPQGPFQGTSGRRAR